MFMITFNNYTINLKASPLQQVPSRRRRIKQGNSGTNCECWGATCSSKSLLGGSGLPDEVVDAAIGRVRDVVATRVAGAAKCVKTGSVSTSENKRCKWQRNTHVFASAHSHWHLYLHTLMFIMITFNNYTINLNASSLQ